MLNITGIGNTHWYTLKHFYNNWTPISLSTANRPRVSSPLCSERCEHGGSESEEEEDKNEEGDRVVDGDISWSHFGPPKWTWSHFGGPWIMAWRWGGLRVKPILSGQAVAWIFRLDSRFAWLLCSLHPSQPSIMYVIILVSPNWLYWLLYCFVFCCFAAVFFFYKTLFCCVH